MCVDGCRIGMRMGFTMRQQVVSAIHSKVLRLNSAAVAHANSGRIINMASNDVRRWAASMDQAATANQKCMTQTWCAFGQVGDHLAAWIGLKVVLF
jgi:hypothetical protein